jgi:hypothetical protein
MIEIYVVYMSILQYPSFDVGDLREVGGFLRVLRFPPPMTEILLKVALNTIKQQQHQHQKKDIAILTYTRHIFLSFIITSTPRHERDLNSQL